MGFSASIWCLRRSKKKIQPKWGGRHICYCFLDHNVQQPPEQSSLLSSSHDSANGGLAAEGQQLCRQTKHGPVVNISCHKMLLETLWEGKQRPGCVLLKLHCVCIYFSNIYSHSEQFHYTKETSFISTVMKQIVKWKSRTKVKCAVAYRRIK